MMPERSTTVWIQLNGVSHKVVLGSTVSVNGVTFSVDVRQLAPGTLSLLLTAEDGSVRSFQCVSDPAPDDPAVLIAGRRLPYTIADPRSLRTASGTASAESGPRPLKSPMPGRILRVLVASGDIVESGQGCIVIEAMKMQNELKAPRAGRITAIGVRIGETVAAGAVLLVIE